MCRILMQRFFLLKVRRRPAAPSHCHIQSSRQLKGTDSISLLEVWKLGKVLFVPWKWRTSRGFRFTGNTCGRQVTSLLTTILNVPPSTSLYDITKGTDRSPRSKPSIGSETSFVFLPPPLHTWEMQESRRLQTDGSLCFSK